MGDGGVPHTPSWHKGTRAAALSPLETHLPETGTRAAAPAFGNQPPETGDEERKNG